MSKAQPTPGPWMRNEAQTAIVNDAGDHVMDLVGVWEGDVPPITAALDLLSACEDVRVWLRAHKHEVRLIVNSGWAAGKLDAAMAKARGES